jgi:hypothetical protein
MIKLTMTGDRRITKIEADGFAITLNGRTNQEYKTALAPLGVELVFVEDKAGMNNLGLSELIKIANGEEQ